ncbi:hypothetical protein DPMN_172499 [Dreissena polymorpha]|uniref:Uncharacterized protein n=1 Tax=Dreissena polymorpha TaxID=45954 RepID=A0A9D4E0Z8_DREPO|nr:hypothetical protein DPMN_172499 [Dreissena polymorpha]
MYCEPSRTERNVNVNAIMVKAIMLKQYCIVHGEKYSDTVVSNKIDNAVVSDVLRDKTYCKRCSLRDVLRDSKTYCETTYCATYYKVKAIMQCPWRDVLRANVLRAMSMEPYCLTIVKDVLQDSSIRMDVMRAKAYCETCKAISIIRDVLRGRKRRAARLCYKLKAIIKYPWREARLDKTNCAPCPRRAYCETEIYGQSDNVLYMEDGKAIMGDVLRYSYNKKVVVYG